MSLINPQNFKLPALFLFAAVFLFAPGRLWAEFSHDKWDNILKTRVEGGLVDYKALLKNRGELDDYLRLVSNLNPDELREMDRNSQIAFYINAYNAITLLFILDKYPPKRGFLDVLNPKLSIKNISGVWDKMTYPVAGDILTLDQIEHVILRAKF